MSRIVVLPKYGLPYLLKNGASFPSSEKTDKDALLYEVYKIVGLPARLLGSEYKMKIHPTFVINSPLWKLADDLIEHSEVYVNGSFEWEDTGRNVATMCFKRTECGSYKINDVRTFFGNIAIVVEDETLAKISNGIKLPFSSKYPDDDDDEYEEEWGECSYENYIKHKRLSSMRC